MKLKMEMLLNFWWESRISLNFATLTLEIQCANIHFMSLSPEAQELLDFAATETAVVNRILDTEEVLVPKSEAQDQKMRGLVERHIRDIKVVGIENLRRAVKASDELGTVLITTRKHQTYFDIATGRACFESEGEKAFADSQVYLAGTEIYRLYRDTHFPAKETSVMVVAPHYAARIRRGIEGDLAGEFTTEQREKLAICAGKFKELMGLSRPIMDDRVAATQRLSIFPEADLPPKNGFTQRAKGETSIIFSRRGQLVLPIFTDGPHTLFGSDVRNFQDVEDVEGDFVMEMIIGEHFTTDRAREVYSAIPKEVREAHNITLSDVIFKPTAELKPDRKDPGLIHFYANIPSVYDYAI